jgi:hypothetical protein
LKPPFYETLLELCQESLKPLVEEPWFNEHCEEEANLAIL